MDTQIILEFNPGMQTLGLASEQQPSDGIFKRLFWPTIQNQYDVDLVGRQGFWLCFVVAVLTAAVFSLTGHFLLAALIGITYFLGGVGVRERSVPAATLIFVCYLAGQVSNVEAMFLRSAAPGNPLFGLVALMLLFANVRATLLSRRWQATDHVAAYEEMPERATSSLRDRLANQMPPKIWPAAKYVFFPSASLLLLILILGLVAIARTHNTIANDGTGDTTQQIQVAPPQ